MSGLKNLLTAETVSIGSVLRELERGSDPNEVSYNEGVSAMHLAAGLGKAVIGCLLQYGGDPNVRSREGLTPLHVAASYGDLETLTLLLHNGANANLQDEDGSRPLDLAIENGHPHCIEELKLHTMLACVGDSSGYQYSCQNQGGCNNSFHGHQTCFDNSCIDPEVLKNNYAKTITQEVYDYLSEGKQICFDVTSPTTPLVGVKKSYCKPSYYCEKDIRNHSVHMSNCSKHESYSTQGKCIGCNHQHPLSPIHNCTSLSPKRAYGGSDCISHSPVRINQSPSCLNCSSQSFNQISLCSPQRENLRLPCSQHSPQRVNNGLSQLPCSPHRVNFRSNHHLNPQHRVDNVPSQKTNCGSSPCSLSPQRMNQESNHPSLFPQRISQSSSYSSLSPKKYQGPSYTYSPQRVNDENIHNNVSLTQTRNVIRSPRIEHKFFPPLHPDSDFDANYSFRARPPVDETGDCPANVADGPCHQKTSSPGFVNSQVPEVTKELLPGPSDSDFNEECTLKSLGKEKCSTDEYLPSSKSSDQSVSSTLSRVAEYVLSCTDFSSQCNVDDTSITVPKPSHDIAAGTENAPTLDNLSKHDTSLSSNSNDSFCTAQNESKSSSPDCTVNNEHPHSTNVDSTLPFTGDSCGSQKNLSQRWNPPTLAFTNVLDDTIMTSENSCLSAAEDKASIIRGNRNAVGCGARKTSELQKKKMELGYGLPKIHNTKRNEAQCLDDSLFSTITAEEILHKDPESGITLVEKWIPSECGSSRCSVSSSRRSMESLNSKLSQDSQATLIYDWKTLKQVSQVDSGCNSDHRNPVSVRNINDTFEDADDAKDTVIPLHLKKLSNEQLSQELQKFGEINGPVIAATRQVYLKRLASLELDPGLVKITKACPDFPNELRQAMNGTFDWSGMLDLEMKMVDNFSKSQGRQWREGSAKSSFTYLLLDPRVTSNLPLRVKDLSELECFKNFICAIFYIGKGKRARPYCHLYEAVSKMDHKNCKRSDKVQHILDVWNNNVGVISLHCFQSVIPVEAYTREACMLEAIGMHKITNVKRGDFYGVVSTWPLHQRRKLGVFLLHKAMRIFLAEGERQICLPDLKSSSQ